jgi:uncharacterized protein DUF6011
MNTNIDYRNTVTSVDQFTLGIARDILATPDTLPEAREYAEYLLTLPVRADGHGAGFSPEPEVKARRTGGGATATSTKAANPADLISATDKQINALINMGAKKLIGDATVRHLTVDLRVQDIVDRAVAGTIVTKGEASKALDFLFSAPWTPREAAPKPASTPQAARKAPVTQDGMYRLGDQIVKVQKSRQGDRLYAKALLGNKEEGFYFEYTPGLINKLTAEDRMSLEEAKEFGKLYEWCCVCSTRLTDEKSIAAGIGPICGGRV